MPYSDDELRERIGAAEQFIDALCMMEAGWTGESDGAGHKAYLAARKTILGRAARARTREEEDAILVAANEIRARRSAATDA